MVGGLTWGEVRLEEVHVGQAGADPVALFAQPVCLLSAPSVRCYGVVFKVEGLQLRVQGFAWIHGVSPKL